MERAPSSRGIGFAIGAAMALLAVQLFAAAVVYWVSGFAGAIGFGERIFSLTYPLRDGAAAMPLFEFNRQMFPAHALVVWTHIIASPLALVLGPLQLWERLRTARPRLHRATGYAYLALQAIGLPCGMYLGRFDYGGETATYGFFAMGALTLACSALALRAILGGDRAAHRQWMVRGYSVMWTSSVGFRLFLFLVLPRIVSEPLPAGFRAPYVAFVFLSSAIGLVGADVYLQATRATARSIDKPARLG
jgi:uncharacterized membrane protein